MAPTGVAAININGTTIHTALAIPKESREDLPPMSDQRRTQIRLTLSNLKLLIIDEISMVSNITLLHIHQRLKQIFATPDNQLFAGLNMIAVGDLYQLPAIRRRPVFEEYRNPVHNLCHPWLVFQMIELTENMRQKDDQPFTQLLNRFRTASHTDDDIKTIQMRAITPEHPNYPAHALHIFAENGPVDEHNRKHLQHLTTPLYRLKAIDHYPSNVNKQDIARVLATGRSETGGLDFEILVKENSRVMLTTNINITDRLINGQMGTITKITLNQNTNKPSVIYIKFDDLQAGIKTIQKCADRYARENGVVPIYPELARIKVRPGKPSSPEIQRLQFPITLAWASTVHKVQGLTVDEIVVCFDLYKQTHFNYGQVYVALSRARSIQGLYIIGQLENKHIRANPKVHAEYERLRKQTEASSFFTSSVSNLHQNLTVCLLNIRSLSKHCIDIKHDVNLTKCNILALTETQLLSHHSDNTIRETLHPYALFRQDHPIDKYSSLAICTTDNINALQMHYFPTINGLMYQILDSNINKAITFLLTYRKHNTNISQYNENMNNILNTNNIDIILGDFNVNYFNELTAVSLKNLMNSYGYLQIVDKPTFLSTGTLLDQVFVKQSLCSSIETEIILVYYSDHDAVKIVIQQ